MLFSLLFSSVLFSQQEQAIDSAAFYRNLVEKAHKTEDFIKVFEFFNREKEKHLNKKYYLNAAYDLFFISRAEYRLGILSNSESSAIEGLNLLDSVRNQDKKIYLKSFYNQLGILKRNYLEYDEALNYYQKALNIITDNKERAIALNNIGVLYRYKEEYEKAEKHLNESLEVLQKLDNVELQLARTLDNLGFVEAMQGKREGVEKMLQALKIREAAEDAETFESYKSLSEYFSKKEDTVSALKYANDGYEIAKNFEGTTFLAAALEQLIILEKKGLAKEYLQLMKKQEYDRLTNRSKYAEAKYNLSRAEKEAERLEREAERAQANMTMFQLIGLSIFVIAIVLILYTNSRSTKNAMEKEFATEQRISRTLHDEVANEVFYMMNNIQREDVHENELLDTLEDVYERVRDISKANSEVSVAQDFDILIDDLIMKYANQDVNIIKESIFEVPWDEISKDKKRVLYRVIQELMTNMKKHSKADLVSFSFEKKRRKLEVKYADNGVGCDLEKGNGLQNVESRIKMVKGHVTFDSKVNDGFYVNIIL